MTCLSFPKKIAGDDSVTSGLCGAFGSTDCVDVIAVAVTPSGTSSSVPPPPLGGDTLCVISKELLPCSLRFVFVLVGGEWKGAVLMAALGASHCAELFEDG